MGLGMITFTFLAVIGSSDAAPGNAGPFGDTQQSQGGLGYALPTLLPTLIINNHADPGAP